MDFRAFPGHGYPSFIIHRVQANIFITIMLNEGKDRGY